MLNLLIFQFFQQIQHVFLNEKISRESSSLAAPGFGFPRRKANKLFSPTVLVWKQSCNLILTVPLWYFFKQTGCVTEPTQRHRCPSEAKVGRSSERRSILIQETPGTFLEAWSLSSMFDGTTRPSGSGPDTAGDRPPLPEPDDQSGICPATVSPYICYSHKFSCIQGLEGQEEGFLLCVLSF